MKRDLTRGSVTKTMLLFAGPMILGNLLQQCYNIADALIVGRFLGAEALAAVGSAYTLMTFLTSILTGLCMGSAAVFSYYYGRGEETKMQERVRMSFLLLLGISLSVNLLAFCFIRQILRLLQVPPELFERMHEYVWVIFWGICFVFLYNYYAYLLRALGNSTVPLCFLGVSAAMNIVLDLVFVCGFHWGIGGAALATVLSQAASGAGICIYTWRKEPFLRIQVRRLSFNRAAAAEIFRFSFASSVQQSVMNFGILMIQGLVNSFGANVMAAFAAAVKIDSLAYMPAQEFGNAFSIFISQNYGAGKTDRVREGIKRAVGISLSFCILISAVVFAAARGLMLLFVDSAAAPIIETGIGYLRVEGAFYCGIGVLFLLYGYFRGINRPEMSLVLTVISLGTRVLLAYLLAPVPAIGVWGIWAAIPIGWFLADAVGIAVLKRGEKRQKGRQ